MQMKIPIQYTAMLFLRHINIRKSLPTPEGFFFGKTGKKEKKRKGEPIGSGFGLGGAWKTARNSMNVCSDLKILS